MKETVTTAKAPAAIGTYSQAVKFAGVLYVSGQIPLDPATGELVPGDIDTQIRQVFANLDAIVTQAGSSLNDVLKFTIYLTDLAHFPRVNAVMADLLAEPYPARAAVEVSALPKGAAVEADAIVALPPA